MIGKVGQVLQIIGTGLGSLFIEENPATNNYNLRSIGIKDYKSLSYDKLRKLDLKALQKDWSTVGHEIGEFIGHNK